MKGENLYARVVFNKKDYNIMKRKSSILICLLVSTLCLTACSSKQTPEQPNTTIEGEVEQLPLEESEMSVTESEENEKPKEPENVTVSMDKFYGDTRCAIHLLGLQQYTSLESESYTDLPEDGKEFLVLFLQLENRMEKDDYFNVELLQATVDGQPLETAFLVNNPQSYTSIFNTIPAGETNAGFIVWQVPKDWKEMKLEYHGWKGLSNVIVHATLTPNDIVAPPTLDLL